MLRPQMVSLVTMRSVAYSSSSLSIVCGISETCLQFKTVPHAFPQTGK